MKTLKDLAIGRSSNVQFIRFVAAILVIYTHACGLGEQADDLLEVITKGQKDFGKVAVSIFFILSGFYCTKSIMRVQDSKKYFKARCVRIFPPLFGVVFLSVFVLGLLVTTLRIPEYLSNKETYLYFLNAFLIPKHNLPGVFENCIAYTTVNGSLWTLPVEFICYIGLWLLFKLKLLSKKRTFVSAIMIVFGLFSIYTFSEISGIQVLSAMISPILCFYMGCVLFIFADKIILNNKYIVLGLVFIIISSLLGSINIVFPLVFPYVLLMLILSIRQIPETIGRLGDYSYCIYLVAYPIQQLLISLNGGTMSPYLNFIITIPFALILSYIINQTCEKPFIKKS